MSKAAYWQRGETLDYKNATDAKIEANTVISFGGHIGVAGTDILPGELGSLHVTGVFEMPKTAAGAVEMGTEVYLTETASRTPKEPVRPRQGTRRRQQPQPIPLS